MQIEGSHFEDNAALVSDGGVFTGLVEASTIRVSGALVCIFHAAWLHIFAQQAVIV